MQYRPLGASGISASVVGLGTWATGNGEDDAESIRAIHAALDEGVNLIDTAPSYGWGHSEEIVGKAIKGRRDKVVIATKCGVWWHDERGSPNGEKDGKATRISLRPDTITIEVEDSLRRLGVDYIDLLQVHKPAIPPENTPIAETMHCLMNLRAEGKIRAVGVSNVTIEQLDEYRAAGEVSSNQFRYSLLSRNHESGMIPHCATNHVATLTYSSLEQGLLTGKVGVDRQFKEGDFRKDVGAWLPWFKLENRRRLIDMFDGWEPLTEKYNCSVAGLVIAWTAVQSGVTHVLCGARSVDQAEENAKAGALRLDPEDDQRMRDDVVALGGPT